MSSPSSLPAQLPIVPFSRPVSGAVEIPGSKSLTNRALLLAALCDRPVTLSGALFSDDTRLMAEALRRLGCTVVENETARTISVAGQDNAFKHDAPVELFVGLAGTAARFLTALCAAAPRGVYRIQGTPRMNQRPMKGLIDALRALGAEIRCTGIEGFFPVEIHARGLRGGPVEIDASESSQMLSALLMVGPLMDAPLIAHYGEGVRTPFVAMSMNLMAQFGQPLPAACGKTIQVDNQTRYTLAGSDYQIEADASAASYFIALPVATDGEVSFAGYTVATPGSLQGDVMFGKLLESRALIGPLNYNGHTQLITATGHRNGITADFSTFSDTFLTLAAIAPLLNGPTTITGIAHTRKQETDRVAGMATELRRLGQGVIETEDSLTITPDLAALRAARGTVIQTYHDHRFAMSFAILGSHDLHRDGKAWLTIDNPACCAKTFPNFFDVLGALRGEENTETKKS
jgi:3-phosphoshikimate 1-carboxyvinyltransferase